MEGKFELQFEDNEYYLVDGNTNDTVATTDKVLLKEDGYMGKLSVKNCKAIVNGYDLDELALEAFELDLNCQGDCNNYYERFAYKLGFQKALEIKSDKKFVLSEEDLHKVLDMARLQGEESFLVKHSNEEIIQSLQQTEWDVEIEMKYLPSLSYCNKCQKLINPLIPCIDETKSCDNWRPQLDTNGCLILKRI